MPSKNTHTNNTQPCVRCVSASLRVGHEPLIPRWATLAHSFCRLHAQNTRAQCPACLERHDWKAGKLFKDFVVLLCAFWAFSQNSAHAVALSIRAAVWWQFQILRRSGNANLRRITRLPTRPLERDLHQLAITLRHCLLQVTHRHCALYGLTGKAGKAPVDSSSLFVHVSTSRHVCLSGKQITPLKRPTRQDPTRTPVANSYLQAALRIYQS